MNVDVGKRGMESMGSMCVYVCVCVCVCVYVCRCVCICV